MAEYHLSPDQLIATDFRVLQSSRPGFHPHGKSDWIAAIRRIHQTDGNVSPKYLQARYRHLYNQARWLFGDFAKGLVVRNNSAEIMLRASNRLDLSEHSTLFV
jgi:hypothetical protein